MKIALMLFRSWWNLWHWRLVIVEPFVIIVITTRWWLGTGLVPWGPAKAGIRGTILFAQCIFMSKASEHHVFLFVSTCSFKSKDEEESVAGKWCCNIGCGVVSTTASCAMLDCVFDGTIFMMITSSCYVGCLGPNKKDDDCMTSLWCTYEGMSVNTPNER